MESLRKAEQSGLPDGPLGVLVDLRNKADAVESTHDPERIRALLDALGAFLDAMLEQYRGGDAAKENSNMETKTTESGIGMRESARRLLHAARTGGSAGIAAEIHAQYPSRLGTGLLAGRGATKSTPPRRESAGELFSRRYHRRELDRVEGPFRENGCGDAAKRFDRNYHGPGRDLDQVENPLREAGRANAVDVFRRTYNGELDQLRA